MIGLASSYYPINHSLQLENLYLLYVCWDMVKFVFAKYQKDVGNFTTAAFVKFMTMWTSTYRFCYKMSVFNILHIHVLVHWVFTTDTFLSNLIA